MVVHSFTRLHPSQLVRNGYSSSIVGEEINRRLPPKLAMPRNLPCLKPHSPHTATRVRSRPKGQGPQWPASQGNRFCIAGAYFALAVINSRQTKRNYPFFGSTHLETKLLDVAVFASERASCATEASKRCAHAPVALLSWTFCVSVPFRRGYAPFLFCEGSLLGRTRLDGVEVFAAGHCGSTRALQAGCRILCQSGALLSLGTVLARFGQSE